MILQNRSKVAWDYFRSDEYSLAWPIPGVGIDDPEALYCPIFSAHAYLLGKKEHLMIVPRFESDPIKLAEPAFRKIYLETRPLSLPDGSPMPVAHELWISSGLRILRFPKISFLR